MKDLPLPNYKQQAKKSQARLDYEEGVKHLNNGEIALAANLLHNARIGFEQDNDLNSLANAFDKLGDICATNRNLDQALLHYDRVIQICQDQGDSISVFSIDKKKAKLYADCGRFEEAISRYLDLIDQYEAMRNQQGTVETLEAMAKVYADAGLREKAADCLRTAASIHANYKHTRHAEALTQKANELHAPA